VIEADIPVGGFGSGVTVKETALDEFDALFVEVTLFGSAGSVGAPVWL